LKETTSKISASVYDIKIIVKEIIFVGVHCVWQIQGGVRSDQRNRVR